MSIFKFLILISTSFLLFACSTSPHFSNFEAEQNEESFSDETALNDSELIPVSGPFDWDEEQLSNSKIWDDTNCAHVMADGSCAHEL